MIDWIELSSEEQLDEVIEESKNIPCLIFKHSSRCSLSGMVLSRLERGWSPPEESLKLYFLDLLDHRNVSNMVAKTFSVMHESPQVLLIKNGTCVYDSSHTMISANAIEEQL